MKRQYVSLITGMVAAMQPTLLATHSSPEKICNITIQSRWQNLETPREMSLFGSKWILAATITFKRTATLKEPIFINRLQFGWNGPTLLSLNASLFKKVPNQPFMPVEEMLLSDGKWNGKTQELYFTFNEDQRLDPVTTFYIVITIPSELESTISQGKFTLLSRCLPDEIQEDEVQLAHSFVVQANSTNTLTLNRA